jgi:anti-sigma regulatory factor (Ser/Thr protein kinase)
MSDRAERIDLEAPLSGEFQAVVRLIIGGIAERVDFAFEEIDDLQLAVERLLAETCTVDTVQLSFEVRPRNIRTRVGPLSANKVSEALENGQRPPGGLTLRRVLLTVVDSFDVDEDADGHVSVMLEKLKASP